MIEGEDEKGRYREYLLKLNPETGRYEEIDHESEEGKAILKRQLLINLTRKRRREK